MKIQVGHSRDFDFQKELYLPIKNSPIFGNHTWFFPHDGKEIDSAASLKHMDIFLAEVSFPSTGLGMELAFAKTYGIRIICLYRKGATLSSSISNVSEEIFEYTTIQEFLEKLNILI